MATSMETVYKLQVYSSRAEAIARNAAEKVGIVRYNRDLDYWDGRNYSNGGVGKHKGITRLKDGSYVLIESSETVGTRDIAYVVDQETAMVEVLRSGQLHLLYFKRFKELGEEYDKQMAETDELEQEDTGTREHRQKLDKHTRRR